MYSLVATIANLNELLPQTLLAHKIVNKRIDFCRLLADVVELLDVRVRRVVDYERLERALLPLEHGDRAFAAEEFAHECALAHAVVGGDARRGVHCVRWRFPCSGRAAGGYIWAQDLIDGGNEPIGVADRRVECQRKRLVRLFVERKGGFRYDVVHVFACVLCVPISRETFAKASLDCEIQVFDLLADAVDVDVALLVVGALLATAEH